MKSTSLVIRVLGMFGVLAGATGAAQTAATLDAQVQAPELRSPERGSIAGQLASLVFGPGDVRRGVVSMPSPFVAPSERGGLHADVLPSYAADQPISEWGMGWATSLVVTRFRVVGDVDYQTDDLISPFGHLVRGQDGFWYPLGLSKPIRFAWSNETIVARLPDGTRMTFGGAGHTLEVTGKGIFAWYLASVETVTGQRTELDYVANASGRLFVSSVRYGGSGADFQHRIDLQYEPLAIPFKDYRSSVGVQLDRRVKRVAVLTKHASTGAFMERWHYDLAYWNDGLGPAFYLASVQQEFASGDRPPPTTYQYKGAKEAIAATTFAPNSKLTPLLQLFSADVIQPNRSGILDIDRDGLPDLERAADQQLLRQTATGWVYEPLPWVADTYGPCRPGPSVWNVPRPLVPLSASGPNPELQVVSLVYDSTRLVTAFTACTRAGSKLAMQDLPNNWALSGNTKLADLNRDHQPDLVRLFAGGYQVLPNTSTSVTISFGSARSGALTPSVTPQGSWVQDVNGDGNPDLVARSASGIVVWYGKGGFEFEAGGQTFVFRTATSTFSLADYSLTFVDSNKDGLADVLLTKSVGNTTYLFVNGGAGFQYVMVPGLASVGRTASKPVVADLSGSGNTELGYSAGGLGYVVTLDTPATGLMASADDGRGTVLSFEYGRARAQAGVGRRQTVLTAMTVSSVGYDDKQYVFDYQSPQAHRVGRFFLGFDGVTRSDSLVTESASFLNEDRYSGVFLGSRRHDANAPSVDVFETSAYEEATFQGIPWKRLSWQVSGHRDATGQSVSARTDYLSYTNDVCPEVVKHSSTSGVLTTSKQFVSPASFGLAMSCLWIDAVEEGTHSNTALNFRHQTALKRNEVGLVEEVASVHGMSRWVLQTATYRPSDWQVETVTSPGKGTSRFTYEWGTRALSTVEMPDGVIFSAEARDPLTGAIMTLRTTRGGPAARQFLRYDGQERLLKQWDDLGQSSETRPISEYGYKFATADQPAAVFQTQLVDPSRSSVRVSVDLLTAAGEAIVSASRAPEGWNFGGLISRSRVTGETRRHLRPTAAATTDPATMDYASLFVGASQVGLGVGSSMGFDPEARTTYHEGVERQLVKRLALSGGLMALTATENGSNSTVTWMDSGKKVVAFDDEEANRYAYTYDVLGRVREVTLPDGKRHRALYDGHGRLWRVERDGVAAVENAFDETTGLPLTRKYFTHAQYLPANALVRSVVFTYDSIGRVTAGTHIGEGGATRVFTNYYDGATPEAPSARTTLGLLTAVTGDGYGKRFEYRADGKPTRRLVTLGNWRTAETRWTYLEGGVVGGQTVRILDGAGALLSSSAQGFLYDAHGRLQSVTLNGPALATLAYDENGNLASAAFANGESLMLAYDPLTRRRMGSTQRSTGYTASTVTRMNPRGLIDWEQLTVGSTALTRAYGYSQRRQLVASSDAQNTYGYGFDAVGLPTSVTRNGSTKWLAESGNTLAVGTVTYGFDGLHRTISRRDAAAPGEDLTLAYGPDGQLETASRGGVSFGYVHDEAGQRLMKLKDGAPVAAYLEEGYLDATGLTERFQVGGRTVGVVKNGLFATVATDLRGSVLAETTGEARVASPFGQRDVHTAMSAAIEYVEKGYDADLGWVRMGMRDYDPEINRFTTADPLLLERLEECVRNGIACNLYEYARANPVSFVDPSGELEYEPKTQTFHIERGDSLSSIAKETGSSVDALLSANKNITNPDRILAGAAIVIPDLVNVSAFKWAVGQIDNPDYGVEAENSGFSGGSNKCNLFASHAYEKGAGVAFPRHDTAFGLWTTKWPATAGELATERFPGSSLVGLDRARIGDVIAWKINYSDATGHTGIFTGEVNIVGESRSKGEFGVVGASHDMVTYRNQSYLELHGYRVDEAAIRRIEQ